MKGEGVGREVKVVRKKHKGVDDVHTYSRATGGGDVYHHRDRTLSYLAYHQCYSPIIFVHSVVSWIKRNLHSCRGRNRPPLMCTYKSTLMDQTFTTMC